MRYVVTFLWLAAVPLLASTKVLVTVVETKTGRPIPALKAEDFEVFEDRTSRKVEAAETTTGLIDAMLLLDTSLVGGAVQPFADKLIGQLQPKEQMAIVSYHSSADLIQDFTSSRELLQRALAKVKYGNTPRLLDALYAAIEDGFANTSFRRVLVVLTTGIEGPSRTPERDVVRVARRNGVSIFPVFMVGHERSLFESLARQTGGGTFNLREMERAKGGDAARTIFDALRSHYVLTLSGSLALGEKLRIEVRTPQKVFASALPLE
jgi:VWFA-related protein